MENRTAVVISLSFGTGCIVLFAVLLLAASVAFIHNATPSNQRHSIVPASPVLPRIGTTGDNETKEQQLNRELGPVNKSKLQESKTGLFSRIAERRSARSSGCTGSRTRVVRTSNTCGGGYSRPVPAVTPAPIDPVYPFPESTGATGSANKTTKQREIDPNTCSDGSCALKNSTKSESISTDFPPLFE